MSKITFSGRAALSIQAASEAFRDAKDMLEEEGLSRNPHTIFKAMDPISRESNPTVRLVMSRHEWNLIEGYVAFARVMVNQSLQEIETDA